MRAPVHAVEYVDVPVDNNDYEWGDIESLSAIAKGAYVTDPEYPGYQNPQTDGSSPADRYNFLVIVTRSVRVSTTTHPEHPPIHLSPTLHSIRGTKLLLLGDGWQVARAGDCLRRRARKVRKPGVTEQTPSRARWKICSGTCCPGFRDYYKGPDPDDDDIPPAPASLLPVGGVSSS